MVGSGVGSGVGFGVGTSVGVGVGTGVEDTVGDGDGDSVGSSSAKTILGIRRKLFVTVLPRKLAVRFGFWILTIQTFSPKVSPRVLFLPTQLVSVWHQTLP